MPLIILTGYPCSGLTYRANQLASRLEETQNQLFSSESIQSPKSKYKIHVVSTHDNVNHPRTVYDTARKEKEARGIAYTRAKRMLGRDSFVILDGMNYIKGYRYQLWCEAKSLGTTCCVVHVGTPIDQCVANNDERLRRKNAPSDVTEVPSKSALPPDANPESKSESQDTNTNINTQPATKEDSDPYPPDLLNNLIFRYEEPSMNSRWDKPLFTVPWCDAQPPIAEIWTALTGIPHPSTITTQEEEEDEKASPISQLTATLTSATISSANSTTTTTPGARRGGLSSKPRVAIKPHQATVIPATSGSSALYNMEKRTSAIVQAIRTFTLSNPSAKAALASSNQEQTQRRVDEDDLERQEEGIRIPVPDSTTPIFIPAHIILASVTDDLAAAGGLLTLPRLQRLRRQWITLNRAYIAAPHAAGKGGGGLKDGEIGDAFVRFLNADFADEVEGS